METVLIIAGSIIVWEICKRKLFGRKKKKETPTPKK